jgi:hypothetical protein
MIVFEPFGERHPKTDLPSPGLAAQLQQPGHRTSRVPQSPRFCRARSYRIKFDPSVTGGQGQVRGTLEGVILCSCHA